MDQIELNANTPPATVHDVELNFVVTQSGAPYLESKTSYHHCSDAITTFITGSLVSMSAPLGPKGTKAKSGPFSVKMDILVDGKSVLKDPASGTWDGMTPDQVLMFERQVLDIWGHMNQQSTIQGKAYGKF